MSGGFCGTVVEDAAIASLETLGYAALFGPVVPSGEGRAEPKDQSSRNLVLKGRLLYAPECLRRDHPPRPSLISVSLRATGTARFIRMVV